MFDSFGFKLRFLRARLKEVSGDFSGAATLLERGDVPGQWQSLRDMYRLRMLVLGSTPQEGASALKTAERLSWYRAPASAGERYAREYCIYISAGIAGDVPARLAAEQKLRSLSVRRIYRNSLPVV